MWVELTYKTFFLLLVLFSPFLSLTLTVYANVVSIDIYPENPMQGDTIKAVIKANPNEEIPVTISFTKTLTVSNGKYEWRINGVCIPQTPNSFTIKAVNVKNLHVAVKMLIWISKSTEAKNNVAVISQGNVPPGTYDAMVHGDAVEGASTVTIYVTASTKIKTNDEGVYEFGYDTSPIPPGTFTLKIGEITKTVTIREKTFQPPPSGGGGGSGGAGGSGGGGGAVVIASPSTPQKKKAELKVETVKLSKFKARVGEPVTLTAKIENTGGEEGKRLRRLW